MVAVKRFLAIALCTATALGHRSHARRSSHPNHVKRDASSDDPWKPDETPRFLTNTTEKFVVDGKSIPEVEFDAGESYSGLLPISNNNTDQGNLFFWFFPTINQEHRDKKEIVIWLNGGPGCSSLLGAMQENGPISWEKGTSAPIKNPWSWHLLTNVVWVEQPVQVGFSNGDVGDPFDEDRHAEQFLGFWKNFVDTFGLHDWKVYVTAESYGGTYGPYIASYMADAKNKTYYDVDGLIIYNGLIHDSTQMVQRNVPIADYVERRQQYFPMRQQEIGALRKMSKDLGFTDWMCKYLQFPPKAFAPPHPPGVTRADNGSLVINDAHINFFSDYLADPMTQLNPCYNLHEVGELCPFSSDVIAGYPPYFNRTDVKRAFNVPVDTRWGICASPYFVDIDPNTVKPAPDLYHLPNVIDHTGNAIIVHGLLDVILPMNGVLLGIQNMTWGGKQGFQTAPSDPLYVPLNGFNPYNESSYGYARPTGGGVLGTVHEERGLTFVATQLAGHEGPAYSSGSSLRHVEKLLGRVDSLSDVSAFTFPPLRGVKQMDGPLGDGTVRITSQKCGCA